MKFRIGFDPADRQALHTAVDRILDSHQWSGGHYVQALEEAWEAEVALPTCALANWATAAQVLCDYYGLSTGATVVVPSNTFMATYLAFARSGCNVELCDCNRADLCLSYTALVEAVRRHKPKAVVAVHIGGHIAFEIDRIRELCQSEHIWLFEDCAHAHGAEWAGAKAGSWGRAGIYSLYATKTISSGEGALLVSRNRDLIDYAKAWRDYGKATGYRVRGLNGRLSEFAAAVGFLSVKRLPEIVAWKNEYAAKHLDPRYPATRLKLPPGMVSGLYKYVVLQGDLQPSTGRVYADPVHHYLMKLNEGRRSYNLPNTDWVAGHHSCPPLYYKGEAL